MFKILHTSDWHMGKKLAGYDRSDEFEEFFAFLKNVISQRKPDVLLISGDVFDTGSPSNETAKRYCSLMVELHCEFPCLQIVVTSGNHDSPSFLEINAKVLEYFSAVVSASVEYVDGQIFWEGLIKEIKVSNQVAAIVCAVPYLRAGDLRRVGEDAGIKEFFEILYQHAEKVRGNRNIPIIATGHFTSLGVTTSDGTAAVGGMSGVDTDSFPPFDYIGLGHIHKAQRCGTRENIRYSGSPVAYSFAEKAIIKSVTEVCFDGKDVFNIEIVDIPQTVELLIIPPEPGDMFEVEFACKSLPDDKDFFVEVNIKPEFKTPENKSRVINEFLAGKKARFCNWHFVKQKNFDDIYYGHQGVDAHEFKNANPLDIISQIYKRNYSKDLEPKYLKMLNEILEQK